MAPDEGTPTVSGSRHRLTHDAAGNQKSHGQQMTGTPLANRAAE
jgi:hypothetical protein